MSTIGISLAVPAGAGTGAASNAALLAADKTIIVSGAMGGTLVVEASATPGGPFVALRTFTAPGRYQVQVAAAEMRVVRAGTVSGTPTVDVSAEPGTVEFVTPAVPAGSGSGAGSDISALGELTTITVGNGPFTGVLHIDVSDDGVAWTEGFMSFTQPGYVTAKLPANFIRTRRVNVAGGNTPTVGVAAVTAGGGGSADAALPLGYIQGFETAATTGGDIVTIRRGRCRDSSDSYNIATTANLTPDITGAGANGLDTGVVANDTWYYFFVIADTAGVLAPAGLYSLSPTAPTLPAGYDVFRRLGSVRRGTAAFIPFIQDNFGATLPPGGPGTRRWTMFVNAIANRQVLTTGAAVVDTSVDLTAVVPDDGTPRTVRFDLRATTQNASFAPGASLPPSTNAQLTVLAGQQVVADLLGNSLPAIEYINAGAGGSTDAFVLGYEDIL